MKNNKLLAIMLAVIVFTFGIVLNFQMNSQATLKPSDFFKPVYETERHDGYYVFKDEQGQEVHMTAMPVFVGDEYIAEDNKHYKVVGVNGDTVQLKLVGVEKLAYDPRWDEEPVLPVAANQGQGKPKICIYHSHSDESYVPTDGKSSIYGKGGIFKVGERYAQALREKGFDVTHSTRPHDPHDANAYNRSRRTATQLLRENPIALVDVHRDAVPEQVYKGNVEGKPVTKVKLVVGKRNPKMQENLQFAKNIKAYLDKHKPGLVEGIFMAKGNYNQDLAPKSILIECGSHTNQREQAEEGVALFADAIPKVLGVASPQGGNSGIGKGIVNVNAAREGNRASLSTLFWVLAAVIIGGGLFLFIATGSVQGSVDKLKQFTGKEFANALYKRKKK